MIKGVIAQQAVLRVWTDRGHNPAVAVHPRSHLDLDEASAYERLHGLRPVRLGTYRPFSATDLELSTERPGAVVVELPLRRAGYLLPSWDELVAISAWCHENGVPLHLDGARLWESAPYFGRSPAEICALADSVYVSFYKGLGGLGGCALAAPDDVLHEAKPWIVRHGGSLYSAYPYALSAVDGLDRHLPSMSDYHSRAVSLAAAIPATVVPDPPHSTAFQVHLPAPPRAIAAGLVRAVKQSGVWIADRVADTPLPGWSMLEITVGAATAAVPDEEAAALIAALTG